MKTPLKAIRPVIRRALLVASLLTISPVWATNPPAGGPSPEVPCPDYPCGCEKEQEASGSFHWQLNIGLTSYANNSASQPMLATSSGASAGSIMTATPGNFEDLYRIHSMNGSVSRQPLYFRIEKERLSFGFSRPGILSLSSEDSGAEIIRSNEGVILQAVTDSVFTDVSPDDMNSAQSFTIRLWHRSAIPALVMDPVTSRYATPVQTPYLKITFINPDYPSFLGRFVKTTVDSSGESPHTVTKLYEETYVMQDDFEIPDEYTVTTFDGGAPTGTILRREHLRYSDQVSSNPNPGGGTYLSYKIERTISEVTVSPTGVLGELVEIAHTFEEYKDFADYSVSFTAVGGGGGGGASSFAGEKVSAVRLTRMVEAYGTADARETLYTYEITPGNPVLNGLPKTVVRYDGSWEYYVNTGNPKSPIITKAKYTPWKNSTIQNYHQGLMELSVYEKNNRTKTIKLGTLVLAHEEIGFKEDIHKGTTVTANKWDGTAWLVTRSYRSGSDYTQPLSNGRLKWVENSDGTAVTYEYSGTPSFTTVTIREGAGDRDGIVSGTQTVRTRNIAHTTIAETVTDIESGIVTQQWIGSELDNYGRITKTNHLLDGSEEIQTYLCCGLGFTKDRMGATQQFFRDPLKRAYRVVTKQSSGGPAVATTTDYAGLTTTVKRVSGGDILLVSETVKNLAGDTISVKSPDAEGDNLPETTTFLTTYPAGAGKTRTTTYPDGSTSIRNTFADGRTSSVSGTAIISKSYDYGTHDLNGGGTWTKQIAANSTEWVKSYIDNLDRPIRTETPDGAASVSSYHPANAAPGSPGKLASRSDPDGVSITYAYDAEGDLVQRSEQMPANQLRITTIARDYINEPGFGASYRTRTTVNGTLVATSLAATSGHKSRETSFGTVSTNEESFPVDANNEPVYDGAWTVTSTAPDGTSTRATYTHGLLSSSSSLITDHSALITTSYSNDPFGRTLTSTDSRTGTTTMVAYTESGNLLSMTDPGGRTTSWTYDNMGRTLSTDLPDTLDADGNSLTNSSYTSYTPRGETAATWGAQTNPTFRIYDSQGRMSELRTYKALTGEPTAASPGSASTTWQYHPQRGFLTAKRDAENKGTNYTYTPAGRLGTREWSRLNAENLKLKTSYTYDAGMLTLTDYSDYTPDVHQTYDNFGRITQTSNTVSTSAFTYDPATLLLDKETVTHDLNADGTPELTRIINRSHDNLRRSPGFSLGTPASVGVFEQSTSYDYDESTGRLASVSGGGLNPPSQFHYSYLPSSNLLETVIGPAHTVTNQYEATRNVLLTKQNEAGATLVSGYAYTVNDLGQRTALSQTGSAFAATRSVDWGYDSLGQVTKADSTVPGLDRAYQYDLIGNRIKSADSLTLPAAPNYSSNALNQYTQLSNTPISNNPSYDADGNAAAYPLPANLTANSTLVWDAENRMISSTVGTTTTTYRYDAGSRRIAKTTNGITTLYVYDGWNPVGEYTGAALAKSYLWGMDLSGSMQGAGGVGGLLLITDHSALANFFPTYDGNGDISEYLDSTGAVQAHYEYDPFGRTTAATGAKAQDFTHRFSTKPLDAETGLYYYGYRYYDPVTGRWPSRDPIEERGGMNLYGFVGNGSLNFIDVLGLQEKNPTFDNKLNNGDLNSRAEKLKGQFEKSLDKYNEKLKDPNLSPKDREKYKNQKKLIEDRLRKIKDLLTKPKPPIPPVKPPPRRINYRWIPFLWPFIIPGDTVQPQYRDPEYPPRRRDPFEGIEDDIEHPPEEEDYVKGCGG